MVISALITQIVFIRSSSNYENEQLHKIEAKIDNQSNSTSQFRVMALEFPKLGSMKVSVLEMGCGETSVSVTKPGSSFY